MTITASQEIGLAVVLTVLWFLAPFIAYEISLPEKDNKYKISLENKIFIEDVASKTWKFFKDYMTEENNFFPPEK